MPEIQFTQIVVDSEGGLYGLMANGTVWQYHWQHIHVGSGWECLKMVNLTEKLENRRAGPRHD